MKNMIRITAVAVITFLAVLSCSQDVSLTSRDYAEINSAENNAALTDYSVANFLPSLTVDSVSGATNALESARELTFSFPNGADFLKKSNSAIEAELKKFLTLFTFEVATTDSGVMPGTPTNVNYEFARRSTTAFATTTSVVIRLPSVPNRLLRAKIDGTVYTVYGKKLDVNEDGIAGEAVYDDIYFNITTSNQQGGFVSTGTWIPNGGELSYNGNRGTYQNRTLTVSVTPTFSTTAGGPYTIATLSNMPALVSTTSLDIQRTILTPLASLFKIQEYSDSANNWVDTTAVIAVSDTTGTLVVNSFTATHLKVYRIYASGVDNLTTSGSYYGAPQKIRVIANDLVSGAYSGFDRKVLINNPTYSTSTTIAFAPQTISPVNTSQTLIKSDHNGKNVTVDLYFYTISVSSTPTYLATLTNDVFNQNFKLAYAVDENGSPVILTDDNWYETPNVQYVKVNKVEYSNSTRYDLAQGGLNLITLTLDPSYELSGRTVYFLIAPGFKYGAEAVYFGDPAGVNKRIGNVNRFKLYGSLNGL